MLSVFLLQNQYDQYLSKSGEWLSGADSKVLYRTPHKDEAINQKVEVAVKQADTRAKIVDGFQLLNGQVVLSENEPLPISETPDIAPLDESSATEDLGTSQKDLPAREKGEDYANEPTSSVEDSSIEQVIA